MFPPAASLPIPLNRGRLDLAGASASASLSILESDPEYPRRHAGTVLVCGYGSTLYSDLATARELRPGAEVIAVNRAAKAVKAFALFTLHPVEMPLLFAVEQTTRFGGGFTTHSGGRAATHADRADRWTGIDYWWPRAAGRGTSTWAAAKMGRMMGFDEIVICGMPLDSGNYADKNIAKSFKMPGIVESYRQFIVGDKDWHEGVVGVSGFAAETFGELV